MTLDFYSLTHTTRDIVNKGTNAQSETTAALIRQPLVQRIKCSDKVL
jgi:hypothetical protein